MATEQPKGQTGSLLQKRLKPSQLVENPRNPRSHSPEQIASLAQSLRKFGQPKPILARADDNMIVAGHGIWTAAKVAGLELVDVVLWDVDRATADAFMVADNRLPQLAADDADKLAELLREIDPSDFLALGFTDGEVEALLNEGDGGDSVTVLDVPTDAVADVFWIAIRGPLAQQAKALSRLKAVMADLPEVQVELGTVQR